QVAIFSTNVENRGNKRARVLLWRIVADAGQVAALVRTCEAPRWRTRTDRWSNAVVKTVQRDCRHADRWLLGELRLQVIEHRIARHIAEPVAIRVDYH